MEEMEEDESEAEAKDTYEATEDITPGVPLTREQIKKRETDSMVSIGSGNIMESKFLTPRDFQILERLKQKKLVEGVTGYVQSFELLFLLIDSKFFIISYIIIKTETKRRG